MKTKLFTRPSKAYPSTWKTRRAGGAALILLTLGILGCTDNALVTTSKAIADVAVSVGAIQTTVINANAQKLITDVDTQSILLVCQKINAAGVQASAIVRAQTKLTPTQRSNLTGILQPIVVDVQQDLSTGLLGIQDVKTRQTIQLALTAIQTSLTAALTALGGK